MCRSRLVHTSFRLDDYLITSSFGGEVRANEAMSRNIRRAERDGRRCIRLAVAGGWC